MSCGYKVVNRVQPEAEYDDYITLIHWSKGEEEEEVEEASDRWKG